MCKGGCTRRPGLCLLTQVERTMWKHLIVLWDASRAPTTRTVFLACSVRFVEHRSHDEQTGDMSALPQTG